MAKYIVFADYVATKIIGEVEADSKEEAVAKLNAIDGVLRVRIIK